MRKAIFVGRIANDLELKKTSRETSYVNFSLAIGEKSKDKDGNKTEKTYYARCKAYGHRAEAICNYAVKGQRLLVECKPERDEWEKDGQKQSYDYNYVESVEFLAKPQSYQTPEATPEQVHATTNAEALPIDQSAFEIPSDEMF